MFGIGGWESARLHALRRAVLEPGAEGRHPIERSAVAVVSPGPTANCSSMCAPSASAPIAWQEASAVALPFPAATFDVVLCQQGLQFFPDRLSALVLVDTTPGQLGTDEDPGDEQGRIRPRADDVVGGQEREREGDAELLLAEGREHVGPRRSTAATASATLTVASVEPSSATSTSAPGTCWWSTPLPRFRGS